MPEAFGAVAVVAFGLLGITLLYTALKTVRIVPQSSVLLIERLGRFDRIAATGLNIIIPFFERPRAVYWTNVRPGTTFIDLREQFIDLPPQSVISRDNVMLSVDSVIYWQITDPVKGTYEVNDLVGSIVQLTFTGMRSVIGKLDLDHTLSSREQVNNELRMILDEATDKWGVKVTRVDIKNITPPEDVRITMEKQMTAERNRRALVLQAEGEKQAAIARAEGEKQASITRAEGERESAILQADGAAQARLKSAGADAQAIAQISQIVGSAQETTQYLITSRYVESLRDMTRTQNAKVIFMPVETASLLSSVGALKEVFAETGEKMPELPKAPRSPRELDK